MSEQDLDTTIKIGVDGSGVSTGITSIKRSLHELGGAVKKITDDTNTELGKIGKGDLKLGSGVEKATKAIIKETSELTKQLKTAETAAFTGFSNIGKSAEAAYVKLAGQGVPENYIAAYIKTLKEAQSVQQSVAAAATKSAAEQSAITQRAIAEEAHFASLKTQWAAHNKTLAEQNIAQLKAQQAAQAAYRQEVMNSELNFAHTGRGKSTAFLADKGQRLGFDPAFIAAELAGYKKIEDASKAAFQAANPHIAEMAKRAAEAGTSVKGLSASMRNVPAQFTDIIISLQGGQAPLTVLLQQGGQLKDMFGGIGNAGRALGGYIMGLVNPFTLAAGAVVTLGLAYMKGAAEGEAYNKAIILTGNAAGTTAMQLSGMAQAVSKATGGTVGAAAAALATLAGSTGIASAQFEKIAAVAVGMEKTTGVAVAETVKQFAELGKDPVGASLKLTESTRHLTFEVYQQIKALTDQGKTLEAGALAQKAYASAMEGRLPALVENLGLVEKAWKGITSAAKGGWDAMLGVGRKAGLKDQITAVEAEIAKAQTPFNPSAFGDGNAEARAKLQINLKLLETLQRMAASEGSMAAHAADRIKRDEASIALAEVKDKFASKQVLMARELAKAQELYNNSNKTEADTANHIKALDGIKKKYEEIAKVKGSSKISADAFDKSVLDGYTKAMHDLESVQLKASASAEDLSKSQSALRAVQASPQWAAFNRQMKEQIIYAASLAQGMEDQADATKALAKAQEAIEKARNSAIQSHAKELEAINDKAQKLEDEVKLYGKTKIAIEELTAARERDRMVDIGYFDNSEEEVARRAEKEAARMRLAAAGTAKDMADEAAKAAKDAASEWKKTADSIENSLTDALMRGFESGKEFGRNLRDTLVNMFKTLILRPIISAVMSPISQGITGALGMSGAASAGSSLLGSAGGAYAAGSFGSFMAPVTSAMSTFGTAVLSSTQSLLGFGGATTTAAQASTAFALANPGSISSVMATLGQAIPYVAIAVAIAAAVGLFRKTKTVGAGISGTFGEDTTLQNYTQKRKSGYLFGGPEYWKEYSAIDAELARTLKTAFGAVKDAASGAAKALGLSADSITNYSKEFALALTGDEAKDKAAIDALFTGMAEDMARSILGSVKDVVTIVREEIAEQHYEGGSFGGGFTEREVRTSVYTPSEFANEGETAAQTLQRLAVSIGAVNSAFDNFGYDLIAVGLSGASTASKLIDAFGGLEAFATITASYYQNFYTEAERTARLTKVTSAAFESLGLVMPALDEGARAAYRSLVEEAQAKDMTVEANRNAYAALLALNGAMNQLAPAFDATSDSVSDLLASLRADGAKLQDEYNKLTLSAAAYQAQLIAGYSEEERAQAESNFAVQAQIDAYKAQAEAARDSAQAQQQAAADMAQAAFQVKQGWQSVADSLMGEVDRIRGVLGGPGQTYAAAQAKFAIATAKTRAGDQDAGASLAGLSQTMLGLAASQANSSIDLKRIQGRTAASLAQTGAILTDKYGLKPLTQWSDPIVVELRGIRTTLMDGLGLSPAPIEFSSPVYRPIESSTREMVSEIKTLTDEVKGLRIEARASASSANATAKLLQRLSPDGNSLQIVTAT